MTAYLLHGCVKGWRPKTQIFRNYVDESALESHFAEKQKRYGQWQTDGSGDTLTVDDSTKAGAEACLLAKKYGHHVIFFINPHQIIANEPYFFSLFDYCLDSRGTESVTFNSTTYNLKVPSQMRQFRLAARAVLMLLDASDAVQNVRKFADLLHVESFECPKHALPLCREDMLELKRAGVQIESHGWAHQCIKSLDEDAQVQDLQKTANWLKEDLCIDSTLYAVPYGLELLSDSAVEQVRDSYFLVNDDLPMGLVGRKCWNRIDLTSSIRPAVSC